MRLALSVLVFFVSYAAVIAVAEPQSPDDLSPYYFDPKSDSTPDGLRTVGINVGGYILSFPRQTRTAVRIVASTITCTLSVANRCGVRAPGGRPGKLRPARPGRPAVVTEQKRVTLENVEENDEEDKEQFPIAPSAVQEVETTSLPTRDARAADPQRFVMSPAFRYHPEDIQSAFESGPYDPSMSLPFHRRYPLPGQQRRQLPVFFPSLFASTTVSTSFGFVFFTVTPSCSVTGTFPQCPNGKQ
ncbi:uncharacterized protein LOC116916100 [Daphnia magna]|uniref:uncharacterized protein LOC116916100 n=1 Tax=Daphnia magna TaxID=35525 RepID=UPI001E1BC788|nr:uncharacterized protein LOC116916100 [Daphnia magna]